MFVLIIAFNFAIVHQFVVDGENLYLSIVGAFDELNTWADVISGCLWKNISINNILKILLTIC
jgi:hypothetical protein